MAEFIDAALDEQERRSDPALEALAEDARAIAAGLAAAGEETEALLRALSGRFISPSPCGDGSRNGREILDDVRRKTPTASRGRLLLLHDGWISLRKRCREDPVLSDQLRELKATCGRKSDVL